MRKVKITKLSDDFFEGNHPNHIYEGYTKIGLESNPPKVGEMYWVNEFHTSLVQEILDENTFKTLYSTYKIEYLEEPKLSNEDLDFIHKNWED